MTIVGKNLTRHSTKLEILCRMGKVEKKQQCDGIHGTISQARGHSEAEQQIQESSASFNSPLLKAVLSLGIGLGDKVVKGSVTCQRHEATLHEITLPTSSVW